MYSNSGMASKNYSAIISLANWRIDRSLEHHIQCKLVASGASKISTFPFQDVFCMDLDEGTQDIRVQFFHEGKQIAEGSVPVPSNLSDSQEIETSAKIRTHLHGIHVENRELNVEFNLSFINNSLYQTADKKKQDGSKSKARPVKHQKQPSEAPLTQSRVSNSRNTSKERGHTYNETELNSYLNKVVDRHFEEAKNRVNNDLSEVSDCVYLNKFNKLANAELINAGAISPAGVTRKFGASGTFASAGDSLTELDHTMSPDKLRTRFSRANSKSPGRAGAGPDMTSILMDTETRRYVNEYKNQLEYLRTIIYALDMKLRDQDTWKREVSNLREDNDKGNAAREELRKTLLETTQDLKEESAKLNQLIVDLENHNKDILRDLKASNNRVDDVETRNHALEIKLAQLENENTELRVKAKSGEIYKKQLEQARSDYVNAERKHNDTLISLGDKIKTLDDNVAKLGSQKKKLIEENGRLSSTISELKVQLTQEKHNNADLQHELDILSQQLKLTQGSVELLKGLQDQRESILKDLAKMKEYNSQLIGQMEQLEKEVIERSRDIEALDRRNKDELLKLQRKNRELEDFINELKGKVNGYRKDNIELKNHIITLEQLLCVKEDVYGQLQSTQERLTSRQGDCDTLRSQTDANSKVIEQMNDKVYETEKCLIYLKNVVADKEDYAVNLKKMILEMKDQASVYIAVSDDVIDKRIAEWINSSNDPNKLTKLFIRERDGVYQFGSKRIYVKIENDKIFIRVGGGFLTLDEFLRIHVPIELEKMATKDPIQVLSKNVAVNKLVAGRSVNDKEKSKITPLTYKNALAFSRDSKL
jgi:hypothetical protein